MAEKEKKGVMDYVDNLVGEEGVKMYVTGDLHPSNYLYIFAAITAGVVVGNLINTLINRIFGK